MIYLAVAISGVLLVAAAVVAAVALSSWQDRRQADKRAAMLEGLSRMHEEHNRLRRAQGEADRAQ